VLQIQPDQLLGVLGDHGGFPVEKLRFGTGKKVVGSLSHDSLIRLWSASIFSDDNDDDDDNDDNDDDMGGMDSKEIASTVAAAAKKGGNDSEDDWEDASSDDSMDSDSDSDNDKMKNGKKGRFKTENEDFFTDL